MTLARTDDASLLDVERARAYLSTSKDLDTIKELRDQAEAIAHYRRAQDAADDSAARASVIARAAERRLGELLRDMPKATGGDAQRTRFNVATESPAAPKLSDYGFTKGQSHRYQAAASVPEEEFDRLAEASIKSRKPLSSSKLVGVAKQKQKNEKASREVSKAKRKAAEPAPDVAEEAGSDEGEALPETRSPCEQCGAPASEGLDVCDACWAAEDAGDDEAESEADEVDFFMPAVEAKKLYQFGKDFIESWPKDQPMDSVCGTLSVLLEMAEEANEKVAAE